MKNIFICVLCLFFIFGGGIAGYNLKSLTSGSSVSENNNLSDVQNNLDTTNIQANINCVQPILEKTILPQSENRLPPLYKTYNGNKESLNELIYSIANQHGLVLNLDDLASTETEFITIMDNTPGLINSLLDAYEDMADSETKDLLRSLLITTGSNEIEQRGLEKLSNSDSKTRADWLALLRDSGIHSSDSRYKLFGVLPTLRNPEEIRDAVLAITPEIVTSSERQQVISQFTPYLEHNDDIVRSAAIETLAKWGDGNQASTIERALSDSSDRVRYTAVSAAYTSQIRSENIEFMLLDIMNDTNEDRQMRIHAHNALSNYSLQGQNHNQFYQFHQQLLADQNTGEVKG